MEHFGEYLPGILLAYGATLLGLLSPGPNMLAVMGTSMRVGRPAGRALALGIGSGALIWSSLAWAGLATVLTLYASVMVFIKIAGGGYLLFLAFKAFRSAATARELAIREEKGASGPLDWFRRGLAVQMTNPKAVFAWIAIMSLGLKAHAPWYVGAVVLCGAVTMSFTFHQLFAIAFSTAPAIQFYARARRFIEAGLGTFFCFAGYKLMTARI